MIKGKIFASIAIVVALVLSGCGEPKVYKNGDLYQKDGMYFDKEENKPANGMAREYSADNVISKEIPYVDGKIDGTVVTYHLNGKPHFKTKYKDGVIVGDGEAYDEEGELVGKTPYKDGVVDGTAISYFKGGKTQLTTEYVGGKKEGKRQGFDEDGALRVEVIYKNDNPVSGYEIGKDGVKKDLTKGRYLEMFGLN